MPYITSIERLALEEGREEGFLQGALAGKIQLLQQILGQPETTMEDLLGQSREALKQQLALLQSKLVERDSKDQ